MSLVNEPVVESVVPKKTVVELEQNERPVFTGAYSLRLSCRIYCSSATGHSRLVPCDWSCTMNWKKGILLPKDKGLYCYESCTVGTI